MTLPHCTDHSPTRQESRRWDPARKQQFISDFFDPDNPFLSRRQFAQEHGIPATTFQDWIVQADSAEQDPDLAAFFRSQAGRLFLQRLLLALHLIFNLLNACGLRQLAFFLRLTGLDRFVASSYGFLHSFSTTLQDLLARYDEEERPRLTQAMAQRSDQPRQIVACCDENFHHGPPCLVAVEPLSGFILAEEFQPHRDAATWKQTLQRATAALPVQVLVLGSDRAGALVACAQTLQARHLPDLFHDMREMAGPLLLPLQRHIDLHAKDLQQLVEKEEPVFQARLEQCQSEQRHSDLQREAGEALTTIRILQVLVKQEQQSCEQRRDEALQALRGISEDAHPFDGHTGEAVTAEQLQQRLEQRQATLEQVVEQAQLGEKAQQALQQGRRLVGVLVATLAWFWLLVRQRVDSWDLSEQQETALYAWLLPGLYWQQRAASGRDAQQQRQYRELAQRLLAQAWSADSPLSQLPQEERVGLQRACWELLGLYQRSSSCVEGRNGRLSLQQHGHTRLSPKRLKALTTLHNYLSQRADGTTAAERFFAEKPLPVFDWLLQRMPPLPRPAARRPKNGQEQLLSTG